MLANDLNPPIIVLVRPQLGENIGAAARAVANFGLKELRIVAPRDGWPNSGAEATSAGAFEKLERLEIFDSLDSALNDCHGIFATSARRRKSLMPHWNLSDLPKRVYSGTYSNTKNAILFGPERSGLDADDITFASALIEIDVSSHFSSINLSTAVAVVAYSWRQFVINSNKLDNINDIRVEKVRSDKLSQDALPATFEEWNNMAAAFTDLLDEAGFFHPEEKKHSMKRNLRDMMHRANLNHRDVRAARGMIKLLRSKLAIN